MYLDHLWLIIIDILELSPKSDGDQAMKLKHVAPWRKAMTNLKQHIKSEVHYFSTKIHIVKAVFFQSTGLCEFESWT